MNCCQAKLPEDLSSELNVAMVPCLLPPILPRYTSLVDSLRSLGLSIPVLDTSTASYYLQQQQCYYRGGWAQSQFYSDCLFYFHLASEPTSPVLVVTHFDEEANPCKQTLIVYKDRSYYFGGVQWKELINTVVGQGSGTYATKQFIYRGEFHQGLPHGWGVYKTKDVETVGWFQCGQPRGQVVQKSQGRIFVGSINDNRRQGLFVNGESLTVANDI